MVFLRPDKPPRFLLSAAGVPRGDKILAPALLRDGTWLIATSLGLVVAKDRENDFHPWDKIDRAALRRRGATLAVTFTGSAEPVEFSIQPKDKRFASILNERVKASVVEVEHVQVPGGQVIVALRRDPATQNVYLQEIPEAGVDRDAAAPLVRAARERLGEAAGLARSTW
ncbi:MAG: hypothetical protein LBL01_01920 [Bifidobacteriaceae bacterium]|jgi:hypothetical protein|nr:hypothetical protein [Bifidobacteriaceae bacterium]